ncbi:ATP-dependent RecD-like DNA helicase [Ligilactobacillus saerimneri]|uniref:SF1B family DNA helicase RecD2 n=1 Tax=Ligilactobacillus saerimneri TaxID=228229 RepID=UPI0030D125BC
MADTELTLFGEQGDTPTHGSVTGEVDSIFFRAPDSFFKIIRVHIKETDLTWDDDYITITGDFGDLKEGNTYCFKGMLVKHAKYGMQFKAVSYQNVATSSREGLITYLSSDEFPGIGKKTATQIVTVLGDNTIEKLLENPPSRDELGISKKQYTVLLDQVRANNGVEQAIVRLNSYGFSSSMAAKIYNQYKERVFEVLEDNPYQLAIDIPGLGFGRADQLAAQLGIAADAPKRIQAAVVHALQLLCFEDGSTYTTAEPLIALTLDLLEKGRNIAIDPEQVADEMVALAHDKKLVPDADRIYPPILYYNEKDIATEVYRLINDEPATPYDQAQLDKQLTKLEAQLGITFGNEQRQAIMAAVQNKFLLLTGGPGTGKTTIINGIVALFAAINDFSLDIGEYERKDQPFPIILAAPTGRAAKRITETTGLPASTIHHLLGINKLDDQPLEEKTLDGQVLIIDETSMVDTTLMKYLLQSVPATMHVILVGDKDQLPSVGPGQVFSDLIASQVLPTVKLKHIYRQDEQSTISILAQNIKNGQLPADFAQPKADRSFIECNANQIANAVTRIIEIAHRKGNNYDDIQVLAPMYRGVAGIDNLNRLLQDLMNPATPQTKQVLLNNQHLRIGDRVLHLVNTPEKNIFNGDLGKVVGITPTNKDKAEQVAGKVIVDFDGNEVEFVGPELKNLTLAYCMSIHKSQGSEFPIVIIPMVMQYARMFARNLLYTGITRAQQKLILLGEKQAYLQSLARNTSSRQTTLTQWVLALFKPDEVSITAQQASSNTDDLNTEMVQEPDGQEYLLTADVVTKEEVDPMIGMDGITPYDLLDK